MKPHCPPLKNTHFQIHARPLSNLILIPWINVVVPIIIAIATGLFYIHVTRQGPVVGYDSYYYLRAAEGLLSGTGFGWIGADGGFLPLTHYPPVYSTLLAIFAKTFHLSILGASQLAIVLICALSAGLLAWYIRNLTGSIFLSSGALILYVFHEPFIAIQVAAMSEGLFFLEFIICLITYTKLVRRFSWLQTIVLGIGLAVMGLTRYAAIFLVICFILSIWISNRQFRAAGIPSVGVLSLLSFSPLTIWLGRNYLLTGALTNRQIVTHFPDLSQYYVFLRSIKIWFLPLQNLPFSSLFELNITELAATCVLTGLIFYYIYRSSHWFKNPVNTLAFEREKLTIYLLGMIAVTYPVFLWLSFSFGDASTRWTSRILSPWLLSVSLLFILFFRHFVEDFHPLYRWAPYSLILIAGLLTAGNGQGAILSLAQKGDGFTSPTYQASIHQMMQATPRTIQKIYTNNVSLVYFNTSIPVGALPEKSNTIIDEKNTEFYTDRAEMKSELMADQAVLVLAKPYSTKNGVYPNLSTMTDGLRNYYEDENIVVYGK